MSTLYNIDFLQVQHHNATILLNVIVELIISTVESDPYIYAIFSARDIV